MKLYHGTHRINLESIEQNGLRPSRIGIVYLSPKPKAAYHFGDDEILLEVETGDIKLTAFEDCSDWEVLCWGYISPENIKQIYFCDICEQIFKDNVEYLSHLHQDIECDNLIIHEKSNYSQ